jgi:hypothetical protein
MTCQIPIKDIKKADNDRKTQGKPVLIYLDKWGS